MIARLRGWTLVFLLVGVTCIGTSIALALVAALLWFLPDDPAASGLSPNTTGLLLALGAVLLLVLGVASVAAGMVGLARRSGDGATASAAGTPTADGR